MSIFGKLFKKKKKYCVYLVYKHKVIKSSGCFATLKEAQDKINKSAMHPGYTHIIKEE
jgi:hypothetical protein